VAKIRLTRNEIRLILEIRNSNSTFAQHLRKHINEVYGHYWGDEDLKIISLYMSKMVERGFGDG
jgi:hypothetical protein